MPMPTPSMIISAGFSASSSAAIWTHVRQFDAHADDSGQVEDVETAWILGEAELGADGKVAAALGRGEVPPKNAKGRGAPAIRRLR